jgi:hypothetical protein
MTRARTSRVYVTHNLARDERYRRHRAFQQLDPHDKQVIQKNMARLKIIGLNDMGCFDLISALGEFLAKGIRE